jgi:hypothetical protein
MRRSDHGTAAPADTFGPTSKQLDALVPAIIYDASLQTFGIAAVLLLHVPVSQLA